MVKTLQILVNFGYVSGKRGGSVRLEGNDPHCFP